MRCKLAITITAILPGVSVGAEPATSRLSDAHSEQARWIWMITDLILDKHVEPPARQEMLLSSVRALVDAAKIDRPAELPRRVSEITSAEQLAALFREIWPKETTPEVGSAFLRGLFKPVPGKTHILPKAALESMNVLRENRYVGTGIQIRLNNSGFTQIVTPFFGGPAHKAGARPGDLIVAIDGKDMKGVTIAEVVKLLQGREGVPVAMSVRQPDSDQTRELKFVRGVSLIDSACGNWRDKDGEWTCRIAPKEAIGYLHIRSLSSSTLHELRNLERRALLEGLQAVVIDLRDGEFAWLREAALVADSLLDGGVMWRIRGAGGRITEY